MVKQEELRVGRPGSKEAIELAMQGKWREAADANLSILSTNPEDVNARNRLGRAYMELGEYHKAEEAYKKALENDPYNGIAKKNLQRLAQLEKEPGAREEETHAVLPQHFIEEVGKSGVVNLVKPAPAKVLARMVAGDKVKLKVEGSNLLAEDSHGDYLGAVEPKHGQRLVKLMLGGNEYSAAVVSSSETRISVIIRETFQHPSQARLLSFPPKGYEDIHAHMGDMIIKREMEYEEAAENKSGFTVVDEEGVEVPLEEPIEDEEEEPEEEEEV